MGLGAARLRSGPEDQQHRHGACRTAQDHQSGHRCGLGAQDGVVAPEREPGLYLGSQLHWEYIERELNKPWLRDIEKGIPNFQRKRDWIDLPDERGVNAFWRVNQNKVLHLSMSVHWRFIQLNQAFRAVIGSPMRTLHVYSDIGGSSIVGGEVTDLLREVQYKQQGRGTVYFEPLHVQYLPLRNTFVDQIESQIAETNGQLVRFAGPTPTILTLHFKRDQ